MPHQSRPSCPHDLGPGITVCLRCRSAERETARARQQRMLGVAAAVVVVAALLGSAAVGAARGVRHTPAVATTAVAASTVAQQGDAVAPASEPIPAPTASAASKPSSAVRAGVASLVIAEGHTALRDGLSVDRKGDEAVVSFDTPATRTRRRDKVEQVVRATLPTLYGPVAKDALDRIPERTMSRGDLLTEVVPAGIRIPLATGAIALSLETRPGQDGPLVVRYRARVVR